MVNAWPQASQNISQRATLQQATIAFRRQYLDFFFFFFFLAAAFSKEKLIRNCFSREKAESQWISQDLACPGPRLICFLSSTDWICNRATSTNLDWVIRGQLKFFHLDQIKPRSSFCFQGRLKRVQGHYRLRTRIAIPYK